MLTGRTQYAHYSQHVTGLIRRHAKRPAATLLDIGCGGGKNVLTLKQAFDVTGVDISSTMLEQAKDLNPECTFVQGVMRTCRLGRTFDAVLMDDAISFTDEQYETTILYLLRDHGRLRIETDHWTLGLCSMDTWRRVLRETGFDVIDGKYNEGMTRTRYSRVSRRHETQSPASGDAPGASGKRQVGGAVFIRAHPACTRKPRAL